VDYCRRNKKLTVILNSYRQVRNLIFDMTDVPANLPATGIHWPTAQATSLQNCVFQMSDAAGTQHQGIFIESGKSSSELF
jgi:glucan 1,3-beta-glucosidase